MIGKDEAGNQRLFHPATPNVNHRQSYATQRSYQEVNEATANAGKANLNCSICHVINFSITQKWYFVRLYRVSCGRF